MNLALLRRWVDRCHPRRLSREDRELAFLVVVPLVTSIVAYRIGAWLTKLEYGKCVMMVPWGMN